MTNEQMLKELIELAIKNGFNGIELWSKEFEVTDFDELSFWIIYKDGDGEKRGFPNFLFNHDFAKAIFGEDRWETKKVWQEESHYFRTVKAHYHPRRFKIKGWQYHLQQLAITPEEDRIKYAYENRRK